MPEPLVRTRFLLGTYVTVKVYGSVPPGVLEEFFSEVKRISEKYSLESKNSYISKLNRGEVSLDRETLGLLDFAKEIWRLSRGAFDPTVGRLKLLWGFNEKPHLPSPQEIRRVLSFVGLEKLRWEGEKMASRGVVLDFSGFAKGYAVDRGARVLLQKGIRSALIDAGGDIRVIGTKPGGAPWRIGIKNPRGPGIVKVLEVKDAAVATSGDYENFFEKDGIRYHHLLDPRTGYPARGFQSVTVVSRTCMEADALATAIFVAGPVLGKKIAREASVRAVLINSLGKLEEVFPGNR